MSSFMSKLLASATAALTLCVTQSDARLVKFGVMADLHLEPNYDPMVDNQPVQDGGRQTKAYCNSKFNGKLSNPHVHRAEFGRARCDSSVHQIEVLMQKMKADHPDIDIMLVPGDLAGHSVIGGSWNIKTKEDLMRI